MITKNMVAMGLWPGSAADAAMVNVTGTDVPSAGGIPLADTVILGGTGTFGKLAGGGVAGDVMTLVNTTGNVMNVVPFKKINNVATVLSVSSLHAVTMRCLAKDNWYVTGDVALTGGAPSDDDTPPA